MSLIEVKNKIQATKNTKKITKAMQLVAASKMKRFQKIAVNTRLYTHGLVRALHLTHRTIAETHFGQAHGERVLFILLTSDKGLCGAMNGRLMRTLLKSDIWNQSEGSRDLITIGQKSTDAMKYQGIEPIRSFVHMNEDMRPIDAIEIIDDIIELWDSKEYGSVHLISPWYENAFTFTIRMSPLLPIGQDLIKEYESFMPASSPPSETWTSDEGAGYFEPSRARVAESLSFKIAENIFVESFYQLKATEYSSRMVAMKKATEAADDRITFLTAQFNRARQASITQQLAELASANEAMSTVNSYETFE